ncbi:MULTISPECIES: thiamine pyrophosphate-binding protein [Streptosporangium]|uniref:Acetolactate synthase-1/2/3 large subunit n=1 Tax=Streptosporangium brasiliense TaxID=47480 RepID=A0ABT9RC46_9ACTN|nr:thiamine pyrophosphate-binding protein [Streptosporangium brasiliense]MDP9866437.1 acetolactate synthase-1/2/3 large subunit [Streptosporangium brasiliense]
MRSIGARSQDGTTVAEFLLDRLDAMGVDAVFGIPGGNISAFIQALRGHPRIRFVIASHEGGAAFMADGYARSTGKLGVCLVTAGPGALNALTGVASAHRDQVPLLVVGGQVPTDRFGLGAIQDSSDLGVNTAAMYSHVTGYSTGVSDPGSFPRVLTQAINVATGPRPCAAYLAVPADLARRPVGNETEKVSAAPRRPTVELDPREARRVIRTLSQARRPLIFLGGGAREALRSGHSSFRRLVHTLGVPVATSLRGKGVFPESDDLSLGVLGMAGAERAASYAAAGIDALVVIGSGLGEWATRGYDRAFTGASTYFHVDLDPSVFGRFLEGGDHLHVDAEVFLRALYRELPRSGGAARAVPAAARRPPYGPVPAAGGPGVSPAAVMLALNDLLTGEEDLYVDMGNCTAWATHYLIVDPPTRIFYPCGLSSMGWSCGAVVGGRIGTAERAAIALLGDGSFLMNGNEVRTAAKNRVGAVFVVLDDGYLGMVNHGEHEQSGGAFPLDDDHYGLGPVDLVQFSRALGADAHPVGDIAAFREAMRAARAAAAGRSRPQVVVVKTDHRVSPPYGERFTAVAGDA